MLVGVAENDATSSVCTSNTSRSVPSAANDEVSWSVPTLRRTRYVGPPGTTSRGLETRQSTADATCLACDGVVPTGPVCWIVSTTVTTVTSVGGGPVALVEGRAEQPTVVTRRPVPTRTIAPTLRLQETTLRGRFTDMPTPQSMPACSRTSWQSRLEDRAECRMSRGGAALSRQLACTASGTLSALGVPTINAARARC